MSLDAEQVRQVALLARLRVADEDLPGYASELSTILDFVDQLQAAETADVRPMAHPLDVVQRLRDDAVSEQDQRAQLLENAPESTAGVFLVPRVIE